MPKNKACLILSNHQNALLDALLIATHLPQFGHFLTRAGVFKKPLISKLLKSLNMLPVYRIRDGWSNLTNNASIFETCTALLQQKKTIIIFPEGSHNLARRVRPLSKGFTRIVFETLDKHPELDLQLIPVGVNFVDAKNYGDSVAVYFGPSISAQPYAIENRNEAVINLKKDIHQELSQLTTDIPETNYDKYLQKLVTLNVNFLDPKSVNKCISNGFKNCKSKQLSNLNWLRNFLKFALIVNVLIPYLIWKFTVQPKINEIEFISTFRFAIAITLVPIYLLIIGLIIASLVGYQLAFLYVICVLLLNLATIKL